MSKEKIKKAKQKVTGSDIVFRIIEALIALAVPVAAVFCKLIHAIVESNVFAFLAKLQGNSEDTGATLFEHSIYSFYKLYGNKFNEFGNSSFSELWSSLEGIRGALVCTVVFFILAIVIALVAFFFACFSNKKLPQVILSALGIVSMVAMLISFNIMAGPVIDGTFGLSSFASSSIMAAILPFIAKVSVLRLSSGFFVMVFLFVGMLCWSGANILVETGDNKKK